MELREEFPILYNNIEIIVDDYKRNQETISIGDNLVPVVSTDRLGDISWENTIIVITSDYYQQAYEALCTNEIVQNCMNTIFYYANKETKQELFYRQKYKYDELRDLVVFRSGPHASAYVKGMDFSDNARAVFEYMIANGYNKKYEIVWLVKNPEEFARYSKYENVFFYSFDWVNSDNEEEKDLYYDALFHAKYLFFTDAYGFARNCRNDQIRVQLWHGCGFKTRTNFVPCEKRYEINTVISEKYAEIHEKIYGLRKDQVVVTGYPKEDWLFHPVDIEILQELGIPKSGKYIFWLPTFRTAVDRLGQLNEFEIESQTGLPILYDMNALTEINDLLKSQEITLVIKLHPFQKREKMQCDKMSNIIMIDSEQLVTMDLQINQLLGWADALISDYSSAAIDYLILNRPMAFTLDDIEEYEAGRGFVFDDIREWLPGMEVFDKDDLVRFIREIGQDIDSALKKRERIKAKLHKFSDDKSSLRVLELLGIQM
ncbi:MAG: CDP-glycerol glycerophosphotransferase family protein [Eubacteriales bacterium]|nr:CDP-glycerol glycerophosphotransferase family protein [Eubacteriales bacterium]